VVLSSLAIVFIGGLIQVSYGAYSMTHMEAWLALFNPNVVFNPQAWDAFLLGEAMPEMGTESLIVWNIRLPRVFVAVPRRDEPRRLGAIFQAVTRNELASPFILGVSSGAGLMILLTLVVFGSLTAFLPLIAAFGGAGAFLIVYVIAWKNGTSPVRLVLAGVIVGTVFGSLQTALFSSRTISASSSRPSPGPLGRLPGPTGNKSDSCSRGQSWSFSSLSPARDR